MQVNNAGTTVPDAWTELPDRFEAVNLDAFVVMPNHVHGIIWLHEPPPPVGSPLAATLQEQGPSLSEVVRAFKSISARDVNRGRGRAGSPVWQRSFYDRIVRNNHGLERIREYIDLNPARWAFDRENQ